MVQRAPVSLVDRIRAAAIPLSGAANDYDQLLDLIGDARFVLLGEASHGTHEFYHERARITQRLIQDKGFQAVAVEADWPDAYRVNRYVRGRSQDISADQALSGFTRFPSWMWRNTEVLAFVDWLRAYNERQSDPARQAGFYGLDLYSLSASIKAVIEYLEQADPEAAQRARQRYACFDHFSEDPQLYGYATSAGATESCQEQAINQLLELQRRSAEHAGPDADSDELFYAEQNARLAKNAEEYYRSMFSRRVSSWNLRDQHMAETLDELVNHLDRTYGRTKVVIWEHNSHIGDARATEMGERGELNVGQLVRERYGRETFLLGWTTYTGTVTAADDWDGVGHTKKVRPALPDSIEDVLHDTGLPRFVLPLNQDNQLAQELRQPRLERAIGVIYRPQTERMSHYFYSQVADQFNAVIHIDETRAVQPLERWSEPSEEPPETYPSAL